MYNCKYIGNKKLSELCEIYDQASYEINEFQDLQVFIAGKKKNKLNYESFEIYLVAIQQKEGNDDDPNMDCFKLNIKGDGVFILKEVSLLVNIVIKTRESGQDIANISVV